MADPSQLPPGVDPSDWFAAQRQQQLSDILTQAAFTSPTPQQPAGGGKYYQAARTGPISALSKLAEAMMAKRAFSKSAQMNATNYANALQAFSPGGGQTPGQPLEAAPPAADPNEQGVQPALQRAPGESFAQTVQGSQPQTHPQNPYNPQGLPASVMMRLYQSDPGKYAALVAGPESVQLGKMAGMPGQVAAQAAFTKSNALDARPGGDVMLPDGKGGYIHVRNPTLAAGEMPVTDAQGNIVGTQGLPGHLPYQTALTAAETAAKEQNTPRMIPQGGGVEKLGYPPTPPALQQPNAPPPGGKYFGQPPTPRLPGAPAAGSTSAAPDWLKNAPKINIPNTPGQSTDQYHQRILDKAADKHIELADKYGSEADLADQRIAFNKEALKVLQGADTGPLSDELTKLRARALELHIPAQWIPGADTVGNTQELKKFLLRNPLLSLKPTFGGRPAASEFTVLKEEASPSPTMLKSTIARLVDLDSTQAGYVKQRAQDYGQYQQSGGDPTRFESYYSNTHPFAKALDNHAKASQATLQDIQAEMKRRGLTQ